MRREGGTEGTLLWWRAPYYTISRDSKVSVAVDWGFTSNKQSTLRAGWVAGWLADGVIIKPYRTQLASSDSQGFKQSLNSQVGFERGKI